MTHCLFITARERGDFSSAAWADRQIEYVTVGRPRHVGGLERMAGIKRAFLSAWSLWSSVPEAYLELDDARMLVISRRGGRGRRSVLEVFEVVANPLHPRDGKVARFVFYWHRDRAFADLGLEG